VGSVFDHCVNDCLQVKLLHRLHIAAETSWPAWVWSSLGGNSLAAERSVALCGPHWSALRRLLPLYSSISAVSLGDVSATSFWIDVWLPMGELSVAFPHLLSFFATPEATVAHVLARGLDAFLAPRLSTTRLCSEGPPPGCSQRRQLHDVARCSLPGALCRSPWQTPGC
jgi:hypothetical protein